jgi:hypothetical protein
MEARDYMSTPQVNVTDLVGKYIKLRDLKAKLDAEHKERTGPITAAMDKAEAALLAVFDQMGMDSAKCEAGTAYKTTKTSATVADMDAFLAFVKENEAWQFLERRVAKTQVDEYVAANQDLPPGINYSSVVSINVRRA